MLDLASGLALIFSVFSLVFAFLLSRESSHEKYWVFLVLGSLALAVNTAVDIFPLFLDTAILDLTSDVLLVVTSFCFAYAFWGLYSSMKKIREKVSGEFK